MAPDKPVSRVRIRHDDPDPSLLGLAEAAFIFNEAGRIVLIRENYGQHRYGPPGGSVEADESPQLAVIREVTEEVGVGVEVQRLIGMYYFADEPWPALTFGCSITSGQPAVRSSGEIAEIGWFDPDDLPTPLTSLAPRAISDAVSGGCELVREYSRR